MQDKKIPWIQKNPFDMAIVPGNVFIETKSAFWGCDKQKILPIGYPRYDLLFQNDPTAERFVKRMKGSAQKLVIWMPTFRKREDRFYPEENIPYEFELPILRSENELTKLNACCKEKNLVLCLKRHPKQVNYACEQNQYSNICFISNADLVRENVDLYAMLQYTDALISDYSSIAIDYLLLNKPIAFALDDFKEYQSARGFVFEDPLQYMPGHKLYGFDDLCAFCDDVSNGIDRFAEAREKLMPEVHNPCSNYCQRVWEAVTMWEK
jgi:CDP-glycerol glycerophosphotransferase (TagB/SpsB family)